MVLTILQLEITGRYCSKNCQPTNIFPKPTSSAMQMEISYWARANKGPPVKLTTLEQCMRICTYSRTVKHQLPNWRNWLVVVENLIVSDCVYIIVCPSMCLLKDYCLMYYACVYIGGCWWSGAEAHDPRSIIMGCFKLKPRQWQRSFQWQHPPDNKQPHWTNNKLILLYVCLCCLYYVCVVGAWKSSLLAKGSPH